MSPFLTLSGNTAFDTASDVMQLECASQIYHNALLLLLWLLNA